MGVLIKWSGHSFGLTASFCQWSFKNPPNKQPKNPQIPAAHRAFSHRWLLLILQNSCKQSIFPSSYWVIISWCLMFYLRVMIVKTEQTKEPAGRCSWSQSNRPLEDLKASNTIEGAQWCVRCLGALLLLWWAEWSAGDWQWCLCVSGK